jgi:NADPH2:quinone reductase
MSRMRAWQIEKHGEPREALAIAEVPVPEPAAGEVRIRVEAAALGLPDVFMCRGTYAFRPELPFTPGQEVAGRVTACGEGASTKVGARVMAVTSFFRGHGGFAEETLALDAATYPVPTEMNASDAAGFAIPYHTAFLGLVTRGRLERDESLLVLGAAGGTGAAAIQLGKALGARVIAVAGGGEKGEVCRAYGADEVIDHRTVDFAKVVRELTEGRGADVIYDPVGGDSSANALECIASEGRLLAVGYASGTWSDVSTRTLVARNASVLGVYVGAYTKSTLSEVHQQLLDLWAQGRIRALTSREVAFASIGEALEDIAGRRATGKLVARISGARDALRAAPRPADKPGA